MPGATLKGSVGEKGIKASLKLGELVTIDGGLNPKSDGSVDWKAEISVGTIGKLIMPEDVAKVFSKTQKTFAESAGELVKQPRRPREGQGARLRARGGAERGGREGQEERGAVEEVGLALRRGAQGRRRRRRQRQLHADLDLVIPPTTHTGTLSRSFAGGCRSVCGARADAGPMELLIVGGGLAAQRCIEVLRAAGDDRPVTVVCDEPVRPYDRPPLSKEGLLGQIDPAFRPAGWYADHGVELRLGVAARSLDPGAARRHARRRRAAALRRAADRHRRPRAGAARRAARAGAAQLGSTANGCAPPCWTAARWPSWAPG